MKKILSLLLLLGLTIGSMNAKSAKMDIIFDSDTNNELDDQYAIAYMLMNQDRFNILAITTNATRVGGDAYMHAVEAKRVLDLMGKLGKNITLIPGATGSYEEIAPTVNNKYYDGCEAVDFIIKAARKYSPTNKLVLIPVGKFTNIALALKKAPEIAKNIRIVWLGSNYPDPGEYNLVNDIPSMNYVLDCDVETEIAIVHPRDGKKGTNDMRITRGEVRQKIAGRGPKVTPVVGRKGGMFTRFGDYALNLIDQFKKEDSYTRALHDMICVAIVLHPEWTEQMTIPAPTMVDEKFVERPNNPHKVKILFNYNRDAIINNFEDLLQKYTD